VIDLEGIFEKLSAPESALRTGLKREGIRIRTRTSEKRFLKLLRDLERDSLFITDTGFAGNYLENAGIERVFKISGETVENVSLGKKAAFRLRAKKIIGFGGGRSLDVAKKIASDMEKKLVLVPTAPSHNGLISPNASLLENGVKKSFSCKFPSQVIIPVFLWKNERFVVSGILDVLGSVTAIEDVFLASEKTGEKIDQEALSLSALGVLKVVKMRSLVDLEKAILSHGLAMKNGSRYCSGSEHEFEKCCAANYLHGELVGIGTLLSAYCYREIELDSPLPSGEIFEWMVDVYRKRNVIGRIREILGDPKVTAEFECLRKIRPERYTLWNEVKIDVPRVLGEIREII